MYARPAVVLALLSIACGPAATPAIFDGGGTRDAGAREVDATVPADAAEVDAFVPPPVECGRLDLAAYRSSDCFCGDACNCYLDIPYGDRATWIERDVTLTQAIDLYVPRSPAPAAPLVVWAHPNETTKEVGPRSPLAIEVAVPLLEEGTIFASIEFRHPANASTPDAPRTDLADAIQFLRCQAADIGIDPERVAAIGRSRGTLAVWTAVQDDIADPSSDDPVARESSRVRGVYAINAQTSYWGEWIADAFFDEDSQPLVLASIGPENDGHAVGDVTADDPPIEIVYDAPLESLPIAARDCRTLGGTIDCLHLPNFGDALCAAYAAAGAGGRCHATYDVADEDLYEGALPFLRSVLGS